MTRLLTEGWESQSFATNGWVTTNVASSFDTTLSYDTGTSLKLPGQVAAGTIEKVFVQTASFTYFALNVVYVTQFSTGDDYVIELTNSAGTLGATVHLDVGVGTLQLRTKSSDAVLATGPSLVVGRWYAIEFSYTPSTGACALRVDGTTWGSGTADVNNTTSGDLVLGTPNNTGLQLNYDHVALNDNQGAAPDNTFPFSPSPPLTYGNYFYQQNR